MWYLKVSSSLLIAVALICMIQNAISLTIDPEATEDQWSTLASSTDQNDLKKISKLCKVSFNNFKEKLENTKTIANKKLPEPNKTTEDIANLVSDIKNQVKNASADLVTVRKLVQKTALRFRDTFKSLVSFTELDCESVNKELESIKKTTVDSKKPLVNRVIRSFGNRYDLNKLANKVLEISSDREKLKNNYVEKKKIAKKEFNSLWNSLSNHSKTMNDNALKALDTFFEGMKSVKSVKKKVKTLGEDALDEIKVGDDIIKLKNAVELAKSLKLKFEDEWNLDSGELTYSEEQKKPNTKPTDHDQSDVQENVEDKSNRNISTKDLEPGLPTTEQELIENDKSNVIPSAQVGIEKLPIVDNRQSIPNTENKDKTVIVQPEVSNNDQDSIENDNSKSDSSIKQTSFNLDINNNTVQNTPLKDSIDNKRGKRINKITSREKTLILPWEKLIQLDDPHVSQQSMKCENLLNNVTPDFDNIKKAAKNSIQVTKNYKNLQNIENDTVKQFYDKMVDTNTNLCDYLVNAADDVCAKVTPINKRYETKFKNDPNIKRIKYLLGKQYDPNQYILKVLDDANHKKGIGGMKKTTYYKMLAVAHNLSHETKEMENSALYAMNKIHEGKLAATNLQKKFNKEKASKACYIRNILLEKENEDDKKNKDENKEKVKESINEDTNTEPLKPDVNLDSVDAIQPSTVNDDNEPIINNDEDTTTLSEPNELKNLINQKENADKTNIEESKNIKGSMGSGTQEPNSGSSLPQNKDNNINKSIEKYGNNKAKRNITRKITHHTKHRNPNDPNDVSEEYDSIEEIDDEEDESNESQNNLEKTQNGIRKENPNITSRPKISEEIESLDKESHNNLNKSGERNEETDKGNSSVKPKVKHYRKRIDPKDGKEIVEEYDSSEEEHDINSNKSGENKSNESPESELSDNSDNEDDTDTPEHLETEKVASHEEDATREDNNEGKNTSVKPKVKHYRKRIDPKDGKEIVEEYESSEEEGEHDINSNKSGENKSNESPESELSADADNEHDTDTKEHLETEKVASPEEDATREENDEGKNTSVKPKVKHYRKRIDPKDGKEIVEEYESSSEEGEHDINSNKSGENKSNESPESELSADADNEHDTDAPEHLETEKVASPEEDATREENDEGKNTSVKPKVKHYRKRIDPKDGKEIVEEYESSSEEGEHDINSNKSGENKSNESPESELSADADNEHDTDTPEHLETEKVASPEEDATREENDEGKNTSVKPKVKHYRKRIDPKDGKEIVEEYESSSEEGEHDINSNKSGENKSNESPESELSDNSDNEDDTDTPEHLETEKVASHEEDATREDNNEGKNTSVKPKVKHYRKRIDPKDGKEIVEEYESSEEEGEHDINSNKSGENKSNESPESELSADADNEHDTDTKEHLETEKVASPEEDATREENDEGKNTSVKPKVKHYRKRIDPKDGKEIVEEYESSSEEGEHDINSNKSGENKSNESPESELSADADNEHDTDAPEHLETEKVASPEEDATREENDEGKNTSVKPKVKHYRKRIDPKDGKEIVEEYESSSEEGEHDINSNKSGENKSNESPESELSADADNEHDTDTPEHLETEKVASPEEDATREENDEGKNTSVKPKVKHYRKRIDPKDGKEIVEEYESSSEEGEHDINSNKSGENKSNESPESELSADADNEHDTDTPEHLETEKVASHEEDATREENNEGKNTSVKPKVKHYRKRIDPKNGKEIVEEYESSSEEGEHDINSNKSGENKSNESPESELSADADNEHDTDTPEHLETEKVASPEEDATREENDEGKNTSVKPKVKHYRKRIDPKDGKEIVEEYESSSEEGEHDINSNKSGENKSNESPESELSADADNEHDTDTPEHLETEKVASHEEDATREENNEGKNTSVKPKVKHYRKRIDPKNGKEIVEEYESSSEEGEHDINSNKSGENKSNESPESELSAKADNEHDTDTPEHLETEKVASHEVDATREENDEGKNTSVKPKVKHYRKRIDPKDGKEIVEEYESSSEEGEHDINSNKSGENKSNESPESELSANADNEHDTDTPEHLETEKVASHEEDATREENDEGKNTSVKPKVKHYRKRIDPKDGKEIVEEYESSSEEGEHDINSNKSGENKSNESPESELSADADNEHDTDTPEHLETEKVASHEEDATREKNETSEEGNGNKSKEKVENVSDEILDPDLSNNYDDEHDEKEIEQEENENDDYVNDNPEKENEFGIEEDTKNKRGKHRGTENSPKNESEIDDDLEHNSDNSREFKAPPSEDNEADVDPQNITRETVELDENENLNSVEGAELNGVDNDNIIPAADSMGEDSSSFESSYEEPAQTYLNDSKNSHKNNNEQYNPDDQPNKISKGHRKRKEPKNGQEILEEYDPDEEQEDDSPVVGKNIHTPSRTPDQESVEHNNTEHEPERSEYEDIPEHEEIPENNESVDHNEANEHEVIDENDRESNEAIDKSKDIEQQNVGGNQPNKKKRRNRKRRDPKDGQVESEEYDPDEVKKDESLVSSKNIDTNTGEPHGESTDPESETPEYEDISDHDEAPETPDHNEANEHEVIDENENDRESNEAIDKSNDIEQQNDGGNQPNKKKRRNRKRRDPKDGQVESEEYDPDEVKKDESPVSSKNIDKNTGEPHGESTDPESETPEYEDISDHDEAPETPDHNEANEHEVIDENENDRESNEAIDKSNDIEQQNDGGNQPNKKKRRNRKRRDPKDGQVESEKYDPDEVQKDESPVSSKNIDTNTGEPHGESTDPESETPEYEDISDHDEAPETPDHNEANEHEVIDENENDRESNEAIDKSNDIEQQNDGGNQPNKKKRRNRKRRDPKDGQVESEEYDPDEVKKDESLVSSKNIDTNTGEPHGESTDPESETPEYEDISDHDEAPETPDHNEANEHEVIDENENDRESNEAIDKSNDIEQQNDGGNQPNKKKRRNRKRRDSKDGQVESEKYDPDEVQKDESPVSSKNIDTNTGEPHGESTDPESETPEYEDISDHDEAPETPDHNEANEHEVIDENENDRESNEAIDKSNDIEQQNDGGNQPNKKKRRNRKRRDSKDGQVESEKYDPDEVQKDESPVSSKNIDTNTGEPHGESTDPESETPEYEDISDHDEAPETPDHNEANEHEVIDENENDRESNEAIDKSNDIEQQNDGGNQPNKKKRRNRKRRDPKDGQVESEEYDPDKVQKDESPVSSKNIDTNTGEPHGESTDPESETPEYEDISDHDEAPETPDHNEANEHEVIDENENDRESNEAIDKSNDIEQQNDGGNQPNKKKRRNRKRRDPKDGQVESEEYDPDEVKKDESAVSSKNLDTNTGEPHGESTDPETETPEYEDISEHYEATETLDHNEANEHEVIDENENDRESNEAINKSNDLEQQKNGGNKPNKKKRRNRKRRDPKDGQVESEEYDPDEVQKDDSPVSSKNIDTNTGEPHEESTDPETETPEYEDISEHDEAPETPDPNKASEHEVIDDNENDRESNEAIDKSKDIEQQNVGGNQPNKKKRRNRKRRDPKDGQVESEEYDPDEVKKDESLVSSKNIDTNTGEPHGESTDPESETPEYEDISDHDEAPETPDHNEANEHEVIDENENDRESNEAIDKSNDIEQQNDGGNQPNKKKRRNRKRRDPKDGQVESEEYDPDEVQKDESPVSSKNIDTNTGEPHEESTDPESETPEYEDISEHDEATETLDHNEANEHEVIDENENDRESNEAIDKSNDLEQQKDGGNQPNKKKRRNRNRRDPKEGQVESEEYDPDEVQKDESSMSSKNIDTNTGEPHGESTDPESETPEYEDISDHDEAPETPDPNEASEHEVIDDNENDRESNEAIDKSNDIEQQKDGGNQPNKKKRRNRKRRDPKDGQVESEEYDPDEVQKDESPVSSKNIDTNTGEPHEESTDPESETPEYDDISEHDEAPETPDHNEANEHEVIDENGPERVSKEAPTKALNGELIDRPMDDNEHETPDDGVPEKGEIPENSETPEFNQLSTETDEHEPERSSNEAINKLNDIEHQNNGVNYPNKKMRRLKKRKHPKYDHEVPEEYDTVDKQEYEPPVLDQNNNTDPGEPEYKTEYESDTLENEEIPEYNQINDHAEISELVPDRKSDEEKDIPIENNASNQPNKKIKRNRKRKDPLHSHEISEEYETIEDENEEINKLETPNTVSFDQFDKNPMSSPNNDNNENNLVNPLIHIPKRFRNRKHPEYDHEISEEYDSFEEYDEQAELKKHTLGPEINDENRDLNNNVIPNIDNDVSEDVLNTGYNKPTVVPQTIFEDNNEVEPESSEYPENKAIEASPTINDFDKTMNVAKPLPRKVRRHRKSRQPKTVNENDNEPEVINDDNNVQEELPETGNGETTDPDDEIEQPELSEYSVNSDVAPKGSSPNDVDETINVSKPRPRKVRRHRKSRKPKTVNENDNEPELVNDDNNVQEELPETGNGETTDPDDEIEQPELSEDPVNSDVAPEGSSPNDVYETKNVAKPRPRKVRRHRKLRQPKTVNENDNEPEVINDDNNVQEELPETGNGETTDPDDEIEQPELSEYSENSDVAPEGSSPNDVDETINVAKPRKRKVRCHRKSRQPKTVNENDNEPEVVNDDNNVQEELPETGNGETTDTYDEIEQPELSENSGVAPERSSPNDVYEPIHVAKPRPRKVRCHRKSRQPKTVNENDNEPELVNDDNNVQEELPETGNGETTDPDDEIEQPELSENSGVAPEGSSPNDVYEPIHVAKPRPRRVRRHRKSRQPKTVNENDNEPEVINDDNNVQEELPETVNGETTDTDDEIEQPELSEDPENSDVAPEGSSPNDVYEPINVAKPRPRKVRRHRKSRQPKTVNENVNEPELINDDNNVQEELPETGNGETTDPDDEIEQPELSEDPENSDVAPEGSSPNDVYETKKVAKPRPRKVRRHRKLRQPKTVNENDNEPEVINDDNNVQEELPETVNRETTDTDDEIEQPELSENSGVAPEGSSPIDVDETINVAKPRPRKHRRHRKSRQPNIVNQNYNETEDFNRIPTKNNEDVNYEVDAGENEKATYLNGTDDTMNSNQPRRKKHVRRKKIPTTVDEITPNSLDTENRGIQNDDKSVGNPGIQPNDTGRNPKKKRRLRRIRTYMVNKATNERIPINDQTFSTTDGLPDTPKNKLEATEIGDSDDPDSNEDNDNYSSFLFKEYNSDQCKRDAYDRFKKVTSQDAKQIAYRSVLDTSEMRSNMLATIKNAIGNVKISKTLNDVDQSLRTVSYSLKTGLKQTVSDLVTKVIPLAKDFLKTAENLKELYKNGPQSTHKMLSNILENESTVPDSAKDVLKLISPQFDVDELINNIFEKPFNTKSLKEKKAKAQRKLISLSKHMDTAISNIDCFVLSAMSAVGIGADTLKLLKSGRVIMSDKHPRAKALRDAMGIIKSGKKIRNNDVGFTPTLTPPDGFNESDEDDDDEDPDQVAQKNEEFLKTVPDLDDNIPIPKKVPNKRQSLGVIVVHPDKQIEYREVTDTSQLQKFVGDQKKKYKLQSKNKHPKFLKLNSKKLIDSMVADVKKKAERNGMSKKEMVEEIIKNLKSS